MRIHEPTKQLFQADTIRVFEDLSFFPIAFDFYQENTITGKYNNTTDLAHSGLHLLAHFGLHLQTESRQEARVVRRAKSGDLKEGTSVCWRRQ